MVNDIVAHLGSDLALELFDLVGAELGDLAGVEVDDVIVVRAVGDLEPCAAVFQGEAEDDAFAFEDREGPVDGGKGEGVVEGLGAAVQLGRVGVVFGFGQDLQQGLALAGHADAAVAEGLGYLKGGVGAHGERVAEVTWGAKREIWQDPPLWRDLVRCWHCLILGVAVKELARF